MATLEKHLNEFLSLGLCRNSQVIVQ